MVAAGVVCREVGDDDSRAAVLGVEVLVLKPAMQGCHGADELTVQNGLADGVPVVAADAGAAPVDVDLYLDCPWCPPLVEQGVQVANWAVGSP